MKETKEVKEEVFIHRTEAKTIIDMLFDNKMFRDDLTRDDLNKLEEYLHFSMNTRIKSHIRIGELMKKIESKNENRN